jgi:hypothetical protein
VVKLSAELHGVASTCPCEIIEDARTALGRRRGGEWAKADACDTADVNQNASLWRAVDYREISGVALNGAKAQFIEEVAGEDGG